MTKKKYALIDTANTFFRAKHVASRNSTLEEKLGMALHLTLASINMVVRQHNIDHVVLMLEGKSFRKSLYPRYKAHRAVANQALTEAEKEENEEFWRTYEDFTTFMRDRTNVSVLRHPEAEADDLIARFIALHQEDNHVIVSSDQDYFQLLSDKTTIYNGITNELITVNGYFKDNGRPVLNKDKTPKLLERDPEYGLFFKILRGDSSDNILPAAPGAREKGTKNKTGIMEAFEDRKKQGFSYNNFMLQRFTDPEGVEHRVKDRYELNKSLIDLNAQPQEIKDKVDESIRTGLNVKQVGQVGIHFMKFCGQYDLIKISEQAETYAKWLNGPYQGVLQVDTI